MVYAKARSPRLGQPTSVESAFVRMFSGDEIPESAWEGQLIYRNETQGLQIFNGNAWEDVVGGVAGALTFVGPTPPVAQHAGDIWFDSSDANRIYVAASAGADEIAPGEWEDASGTVPPVTENTWIYRQDTAPGPSDTPPPKENDFWFETPLNKQYYYKASAPGTHWVGVRDGGIDLAIVTSVVQYSVNSSETVAPTTGWSATQPTRTPGTFIWVRTVTTRGDGSSSTSAPALFTGNTGSTGAPGAPGAAAAVITLSCTAQTLISPAGGGATTPTTTTVSGVATNTTIDKWEYSTDGGASWSNTAPTGAVRTGNNVTITGATMAVPTIGVRMSNTASGVMDVYTVAKVSNGAAGSPGTGGAAGADAYTILLTNEAQVIPGTTTAAIAGSFISGVIAYKGATQIAATIGTITGQVTGLTTTIQNNTSTTAQFTVAVTTSLVTTGGTLTVPITADGVSFTKKFAWSLSLAGATGSTGSPGTNGTNGTNGVSITSVTPYFAMVNAGSGAPTQPSTATPIAPWTSTEPSYVVGKELWRTEKISYSNATFTYTTVVLVSSYTAAGAAMTAANGKNTIYYSTAAPTGGTYIEGDTWFDVDADYAMSVYTSGAWVLSQFGAGAVADASITNAKITDATIESAKIVGLDAGKITAGSMNANLVVGGMISTSPTGTGQRVEITGAQGLINYGPDNVPRVILPTGGTDPAVLRGVAEVDSLTVKGDATMQGTTSIATGKDLVLTTGVSPPPVAPSLSMVYATETSTDPVVAGGSGAKWGLIHDGTNWNRLIYKSSDKKYYMQKLDAVGAVVSTTNTGITTTGSTRITFCRTSSRWYFLLQIANAPFANWQFIEMNLSFSVLGTWYYGNNADTNNLPSIFFRTDATLGSVITIAQVKSDGSMGFRHYNTSGTLLNSGTHNPSTPYASATDLGTAYVGTADFTGGVGRVLIPFRKGNYAFCEVFTEASMAPDGTRSFALCSFSGGIGYDGTSLWSADRDLLTLIRYSTLQYETGSSMYFSANVASTYYDNASAKETNAGPVRSVASIPKRCSIRLSIGGLAPGADSVRFHYGPSTTLAPFATQPGVGAITVLYTSLATSGTTPAVSNFTAGSPSRLLAGSAVLLKGDEYGTFAPGDMKMISYVPTEPSGTIVIAGGSWLYCDGALVDKTVYARLFAKIAHQYNGNVDPGSNQFRLPDMQSRFPIGFGTFAGAPGANEGQTEANRTPLHSHAGGGSSSLAIGTSGSTHTHNAGSLVNSDTGHQTVSTTATGGSAARVFQIGGAGDTNHSHGISGAVNTTNSGHTHDLSGSTALSSKTGSNHTIPFSTVGFLIKV